MICAPVGMLGASHPLPPGLTMAGIVLLLLTTYVDSALLSDVGTEILIGTKVSRMVLPDLVTTTIEALGGGVKRYC